MPNHFHAMLTIDAGDPDGSASLSAHIQWFKSVTITRYAKGVREHGWQPFDGQLWQRSFHDRIVRSDREWDVLHAYIEANPGRWEQDRLHTD